MHLETKGRFRDYDVDDLAKTSFISSISLKLLLNFTYQNQETDFYHIHQLQQVSMISN